MSHPSSLWVWTPEEKRVEERRVKVTLVTEDPTRHSLGLIERDTEGRIMDGCRLLVTYKHLSGR